MASMASPASSPLWQQGQTLSLSIDDLSNSGDGVGRWQERVVFVPNGVPGDRLSVRLTRVKPAYGFAKLLTILEPSPHRIRAACIVADKCGGCQWQSLAYGQQLQAKQNQVQAALERIGGLTELPIAPILAAPQPLGYRNKATYPLARGPEGSVKAGYYRRGTHQIVNLNQCPIQDERLNPLLAAIKQAIQAQGWSIYDEKQHRGKLRHLSLRIGYYTGQVLLTLVSNGDVPGLTSQAHQWLEQFPALVGVCLNHNPQKSNAIFGRDTVCVAGQGYLEERFLGLRLRLRSTTFFQVNTRQAEALVETLLAELALQGTETVIDAYCGVGTLSLPLARQAKRCVGIELQSESVAQARQNAALNGIDNAVFIAGPVEEQLRQQAKDQSVDAVVLDPPRKGCDPEVLQALIDIRPRRLAYMSCNPSTLARDLKQLVQGGYRVQQVQPADFFPQTAHVECLVMLSLASASTAGATAA